MNETTNTKREKPIGLEISFTGTRKPRTRAQLAALRAELIRIQPVVAHHGCCIGADADFHSLCKELGIYTIGHPAFVLGHPMRAPMVCDEFRPIMGIWPRNRAIVTEGHGLLAMPFEIEHQPVGGTWGTYDIAMQMDKPREIIWPNGGLHSTNWHRLGDGVTPVVALLPPSSPEKPREGSGGVQEAML